MITNRYARYLKLHRTLKDSKEPTKRRRIGLPGSETLRQDNYPKDF